MRKRNNTETVQSLPSLSVRSRRHVLLLLLVMWDTTSKYQTSSPLPPVRWISSVCLHALPSSRQDDNLTLPPPSLPCLSHRTITATPTMEDNTRTVQSEE